MATPNDTPARIVDAALRVIARRGPVRMSMSDAAEAAAISRGTLYRYFKSKDELMEAISHHVRRGVLAALDDAIARQPAVTDRLRATVEAVLFYGDTHPEVAQVIDAEPAYSLAFIREIFPQFIDRLTEVLEPVLANLAVVRDGQVTRESLAELLLRAITSMYFVPTADPDRMVDAILALWTSATDPCEYAENTGGTNLTGGIGRIGGTGGTAGRQR